MDWGVHDATEVLPHLCYPTLFCRLFGSSPELTTPVKCAWSRSGLHEPRLRSGPRAESMQPRSVCRRMAEAFIVDQFEFPSCWRLRHIRQGPPTNSRRGASTLFILQRARPKNTRKPESREITERIHKRGNDISQRYQGSPGVKAKEAERR